MLCSNTICTQRAALSNASIPVVSLSTDSCAVVIVRELMGETLPPPPLVNFGDLYFQKPYTLSCSDQLVCTYIAGTFALEGQLKVGTSLILGVGVTF